MSHPFSRMQGRGFWGLRGQYCLMIWTWQRALSLQVHRWYLVEKNGWYAGPQSSYSKLLWQAGNRNLISLTKANAKSSIWVRKRPCKGRGQHGLARRQLCRKELGGPGRQRAENEPADCWPATDSCILSSTSKTGQEVFPFIWHPWSHILQFGVLHYKENIDRVLWVHWRAPR